MTWREDSPAHNPRVAKNEGPGTFRPAGRAIEQRVWFGGLTCHACGVSEPGPLFCRWCNAMMEGK